MACLYLDFVLRFSGMPCRRSVSVGILAVASSLLLAACGSENPLEPPPPPTTCAYSLSVSALSFQVPGGSAQITVSTASHCTWTATTDVAWLSIADGASRTGPGSVTIVAQANQSTSEREAVLVVAAQPVPVKQACLGACAYEIAPAGTWVLPAGGPGTVEVSAPDHCAWTAASHASWVTITGGSAGTGRGQVRYVVEPNAEPAERSTTLAIASHNFWLRQDGRAQVCEYSVAPVSFTPCMTSPDLSATLTTAPGCPWTVTSGASWLTLLTATSGTGPAVITFRVADNWEAPRSGVAMVRWPSPTEGQNLQVAQAGCSYAVSQAAFAFAGGGGSGSFDVVTASDPITCGGPLQNACLWTATTDVAWISITTSLPRSGDDRLNFTVAPNTGAARTGTIRVRDKVVAVTQSAGS